MAMLDRMNRELKKYGITPRGSGIFRVVWSDNERELRQGTFNDYYGRIFLRTFTGTREVKKYPYIKERWILEKWVPPALCQFPDLPKAREEGTYEPIYVFQDKNCEPLPINIDVCKMIIKQLFTPRTPGEIKQALDRVEEQRIRDEDNFVHDVIWGDHSDTADRMKNHEGICIDGRKVEEQQKIILTGA